ncbi:MAG TPA: hypothetical protein VFZ34_04585 [Blastocatellia bacterium]|nr:hypothetical protein [Blastocatellia bacterium]
MWQVVSASPRSQSDDFDEWNTSFPCAEIDELIAVVTNWNPVAVPALLPPRKPPDEKPQSSLAPTNVLHFKKKVAPAVNPQAIGATIHADVISTLEIPPAPNSLVAAAPTPELGEQLHRLRTTVLLAIEQKQLRSVLLCHADAAGIPPEVGAHLSELLADFARLKVAYLPICEDRAGTLSGRKVLPLGYTFQIRRTPQPNRYEIASSLGAVRLEDWLQWWRPSVVLREMERVFDVVVISAPSITTHPDVALLAGAVDGVILMATENVTSYEQLQQATQALQQAQAKILGVTLQQSPATTSTFSAVAARVREMFDSLAGSR